MSEMKLPEIDFQRVDQLIESALAEDLGERGDTTTLAVIPPELMATAVLLAKEDLVCAGLPVAERVFRRLDGHCRFEALVKEGEFCPKGTLLARIAGRAQALLTAERTALNFLQRLCGVATCARRYADALRGSGTQVLDTRKTTPGYRNLEKYAVAAGGAANHRIGLFDRVMIKDNHRELAGLEGAGGIGRSVARARRMFPDLEVQVEADSLNEVREALEAGADYILLDNMSNEMMAEAVKMTAGRAKLEASGGITLERLPSIGKLGVDFVSAGALTHSVKSADISMDIEAEK
ncbi:carboxylating nicotinate-nucleotide diphosphorylase [Victivallis sp. Marseille-Q1083]|uniref:carboxylating nicotinate-nucleotide diphosphorylase n=1 Tax=Victivallis sp. Marseille-Q1083 TaxID=2717288 RepID=UPI001C376175|nr:carboxylating nicotinate-nucleotide diphosphorylase [Victivallis sp. Marseille-Q1083]